MAITVDWGTGEITIPQSFMIQTQVTPIPVYQLNLADLRTELRLLEESPLGMAEPTILNYAAPTSVGGVTLAAVFIITDFYTITFVNGQYAVNIVGGNTNIADRVNINNVGVRTTNSAGLQDLSSLQAASFDGGVTIRPSSVYFGTTYPVGTRGFPVNNLIDAQAIAAQRGLSTFYIAESLLIDDDILGSGYTFQGDNPALITITVGSLAEVSSSIFRDLTIEGVLDNFNILDTCIIKDVTHINGIIKNSSIESNIVLDGVGEAEIINCTSGAAASSNHPHIRWAANAQTDLIVRNYSGDLGLNDCLEAAVISSIDFNSGRLHIDSNMLAGNHTIRGICNITYDAGYTANIIDDTLTTDVASITVDDTAILNAIAALNNVSTAEVRAAFNALDFQDKNTELEIHTWLDSYANKDSYKADEVTVDLSTLATKLDLDTAETNILVAVDALALASTPQLYTPTNIVRVVGTDEGNDHTVLNATDNIFMSTRETISGLEVLVEIDSTPIETQTTSVKITGYYDSNTASHQIDVFAFNYTTNTWVFEGILESSSASFEYTLALSLDNADPTTGAMQLKFLHNVVSPYRTQHVLRLDSVIWEKVATNIELARDIAQILENQQELKRDTIISSGFAQGSGIGNNQIELAAFESTTNGAYDPSIVTIISGPCAGQTRVILEYNGTTKMATVHRDWKSELPTTTSRYVISPYADVNHVNEGLLVNATTTTAQLNALASDAEGAYEDQTIFLVSGTGQDQARRITGYNATTKTVTLSKAWDRIPDSTSGYVMLPTAAHDNTALLQLETKVEADSRQAILVAEHDSTRSSIANLNDFDPAVDTIISVQDQLDILQTEIAGVAGTVNDMYTRHINPSYFYGQDGITRVRQADAYFVSLRSIDGLTEINRITFIDSSGNPTSLLNSTGYI
jgi:hypothetical protein